MLSGLCQGRVVLEVFNLAAADFYGESIQSNRNYTKNKTFNNATTTVWQGCS